MKATKSGTFDELIHCSNIVFSSTCKTTRNDLSLCSHKVVNHESDDLWSSVLASWIDLRIFLHCRNRECVDGGKQGRLDKTLLSPL